MFGETTAGGATLAKPSFLAVKSKITIFKTVQSESDDCKIVLK
jgi:hypothetical protein